MFFKDPSDGLLIIGFIVAMALFISSIATIINSIVYVMSYFRPNQDSKQHYLED
jgi:hypothetical protein